MTWTLAYWLIAAAVLAVGAVLAWRHATSDPDADFGDLATFLYFAVSAALLWPALPFAYLLRLAFDRARQKKGAAS